MQASCQWGYFDGTNACLEPKVDGKPTDDEQEKMEKWDHDDLITHYLLSQHLPDTTAIQVGNFNTAKEWWQKVSNEYTAKSTYAQNNLKQAFLEMHCTKGADVRAFLSTLCYKCEELAAAGVIITKCDYLHTVLRGIPDELAKFASGLLLSTHLVNSLATIDTDTLINHICEEAKHLKNRRAHDQPSRGGKKEGQPDKALTATSSENRRGQRRKGKCHNCGKPEHWACECHSPKKEEGTTTQQGQASSGTSSKPKNKPVRSVNIVTVDDSEGDGFWMAKEEGKEATHAHEVSTEPGVLLNRPESPSAPYAETKELEDFWDDLEDNLEKEGEEWMLKEEVAGAVITPVEEDSTPHIKLYDSGATQHISPYKTDFTSYSPLSPPIFLNAANQQQFQAVGTGTLVVQVPNKGTKSELVLHGTLHVPSIGYTLVSLGVLDEEGYRAHIGAGHLELVSPKGEQIGHIVQTSHHLYKVLHTFKSANAAEIILAMELHCRLGHIAVASAWKLVESGAIVGIELDPNSQEHECDACVYAQATHLAIPKPQISHPAQHFSDVIHTDVWGPASTSTRQGRQYFITFTDDSTHFTIIYLLKTKNKVLAAYKSFEAWALTQ